MTPIPTVETTSPEAATGQSLKVVALTFVVALAARLAVIAIWPDPWQFDAYQRWAGRDHLWVQVWLPATQTVVAGVAALGGNMMVLRLVMSVLAAVTVAMGAALARRLGSPASPWFYLPMAIFAPYMLWSSVPYQESTFLFVLFASLLVGRRSPIAADLILGAIAFCRYEGWPLLLVHIALSRRWSSLLSLWGVAVYFALKKAGLAEPYAASPDSFADWNGFDKKLLRPHFLMKMGYSFLVQVWGEGVLLYGLVAALAVRSRRVSREAWMLVFGVLGQLAATAGWLISLGSSLGRMMILPGMMVAVLSSAELGRRWPHFDGKRRGVVVFTIAALTMWSMVVNVSDINVIFNTMQGDIQLVRIIEKCPGEVWRITPRRHPGPRMRHDGCEVVQGLTDLRAGIDFSCVNWRWEVTDETLYARWAANDGEYRIVRLAGTGAESCPF